MILLKQSTSTTLKMGPFVDSTDGNTPETGLTIGDSDVRLSKNGGPYAQRNYSGANAHDEGGEYYINLDTTDTNSLGILKIRIHVSGALYVAQMCHVVPANVYDSLILGSDYLQADALQLGGSTQSATDLKDFADAGYDPATNKVEGVKLVDTTTTNTDMRGTNSAALASVCTESRLAELDAGNLPGILDATKTDTEDIKLKTDNLPSDPADASVIASAFSSVEANQTTITGHLTDIKGATFSSSTDSLEAIRNRGDAAWITGGSGSGATEKTYTVTDGTNPIADVYVWVSTDSSGSNVIASGYTNDSGEVVFYLTSGTTYYLWRKKSGYNFTNPDVETA